MVPWIYDFLLVLMLFVLYKAGSTLAETGRVKSPAGFAAIGAYTLNEGLRFGRGIDYNLYGMSYEQFEATGISDWDISFQYVARLLIEIGIPWQGYVLLMSFTFIIATTMLINFNYKEVLPYALPLFALFSKGAVENMVRWYLGFSFILIGLAFLLREKKANLKYWTFSVFACTFHLALLPLPFIIYILSLRKTPLLSPLWAIILYFGIGIFFQTDFMMQFVNIANLLSTTMGESSERLANYGDRAEYWLTGGFAGTMTSAFPNMQEIAFLCCLVWIGYMAIKDKGEKYIFAYNMFIVGLLAYPLALQIELIGRFDAPFMFFQAIVLASIIKYVFIDKEVTVNQLVWLLSFLIVVNMGRKILVTPFKVNPEKYLYVWDSDTRTYQGMYDMWLFDMYNSDAKKKRTD